MEMCPHRAIALLFLGVTLRSIPQIAALEQVSCNETQYQNKELNICCNRCQPGFYRKETCTLTTETLCQPCRKRTFTSSWNYLTSCISCDPCGRSFVEKEPCSPTHNTICVCPEGETCAMYDGIGECRLCETALIPAPTTTTTTTMTTPGPTESSPADTKTLWIILGVVLFIVTMSVVVICIKTSLLKRFGRMIKNKRSSESVPQTETAVGIMVIGNTKGGPASPLLNGGPNKMPQQEQERSLCYPIQETDATQSGVITLLVK